MGTPVVVNAQCALDSDELVWRFEPAGGPGGQHANRAHTRAVVTFDAATSPSLTESQRARLLRKLGPVITVAADDERSQRRNRDLAQRRLVQRLDEALYVPPPRRKTRPSAGSVRRRLEAKAQHAQRKAGRRRPGQDD
ncbi:MAG: aminoacyl-tRNA hydrolase [Acidimicrobiales bacterium]|nr:aminoacyl-tRNA hydrolase [Acidimicrobiales bacterium]